MKVLESGKYRTTIQIGPKELAALRVILNDYSIWADAKNWREIRAAQRFNRITKDCIFEQKDSICIK